jgi:hypothetical protein
MVSVKDMSTLLDKVMVVLKAVEGMDDPEAMLAFGVALKAKLRKLEGGVNYDEASLLAKLMEKSGSILTSIEAQTEGLVAKVEGNVKTPEGGLN